MIGETEHENTPNRMAKFGRCNVTTTKKTKLPVYATGRRGRYIVPPADGSAFFYPGGEYHWCEERPLRYPGDKLRYNHHHSNTLYLRNYSTPHPCIVSREAFSSEAAADAAIERGAVREVGRFEGGELILNDEFNAECASNGWVPTWAEVSNG